MQTSHHFRKLGLHVLAQTGLAAVLVTMASAGPTKVSLCHRPPGDHPPGHLAVGREQSMEHLAIGHVDPLLVRRERLHGRQGGAPADGAIGQAMRRDATGPQRYDQRRPGNDGGAGWRRCARDGPEHRVGENGLRRD